MSQAMRSTARQRPRPKPSIEPVHVDELLLAPGMGGFLGILDPPVPVPHLQKLVDELRGASSQPSAQARQRNPVTAQAGAWEALAATALDGDGLRFSSWFCDRTGALLGRMWLQEKELSGITEAWLRVAADVEKLHRQATLICFAPAIRKEINQMKKMRTASARLAHRPDAAEATWEEWISPAEAKADSPGYARVPTARNGNRSSLQEAISRLAYSYWEARGQHGGSAEEDWLRAEAEICRQA
jgi:hypothetical protein